MSDRPPTDTDVPTTDTSKLDWLLSKPTRDLAETLRDEGIERAADGSEREIPGWQDLAFGVLLEFIANPEISTFMTEDVRHWGGHRIPKPRDARAWGQVTRRAKKAGLIVYHGPGIKKDPLHHRMPGNVWAVVRPNA